MSKVNKPNQTTITNEDTGNKYIIQVPSNMIALEILDATEDTSNKFKMGPSVPLMIEHMIVEPQGLDVDSFDNLKELIWLGGKCFRFLSDPDSVARENTGEVTE